MRWDRKKLPKPNLHVYGENGTKIMVYNMKMCLKRKALKTKGKKRKWKKYNTRRKNSRYLIILFWLGR